MVAGRVSETFFSIQGEGPTAGMPAVFIRLQGCSIGCSWCDTKYAWPEDGGRETTLEELVSVAEAYPCRRVVITGGEPLESSLLVPLTSALAARGFEIEVETSGALAPPADTPAGIAWNVSVKLGSSGVSRTRRINPGAIRALLRRDAWWKFVVVDDDDLAEVVTLADRYVLPRDRILLQPQAVRREELIERSAWVIEACKRHGFRYSPRLHVLMWGARRGV